MHRTHQTHPVDRLFTLIPLMAMAALAGLAGFGVPVRADEGQPQTSTEAATFEAIRVRLETPENQENMPLPVTDTLSSLDKTITKTFTGRDGAKPVKVTVRIRTRPIHWDPTFMGDSEYQPGGYKTVGRYGWRIIAHRAKGGREITVNASNILMLDDRYMEMNERDTLGRIANEAVLYHELLHGQLMINMVGDERWRDAICRTGRFDLSGTDPQHRFIYDLEGRFLMKRGDRYAYAVPNPTVTAAANGTGGTFRVLAGRVPARYTGEVSGSFRMTAHGNVQGVKLDVIQDGPRRGQVFVTGTLTDPRRGGFFLAVVDPVIRAADPGPPPVTAEPQGIS